MLIMTPSITLFHPVTDEYAPRYYRLSGSEYPTLVAAVKALTYREWGIIEGGWRINGEGLRTLRAQGYTVEQEPDFRFAPFQPLYHTTPSADGTMSALVTFEQRNRNGDWEILLGKRIRFPIFPGDKAHRVAAAHVEAYGETIVAFWHALLGGQRTAEAVAEARILIEQRINQTAPLYLLA